MEAGEQAGALESLLDKIATYKEKTEAHEEEGQEGPLLSRGGVSRPLHRDRHPADFRDPAFRELFKGFGADLPAFTQFVINLSLLVQHQGIYLAVVFGGGVYAFIYFKKRSRKMRELLDRISLKFPIIGPIINKAAIARYARTLSTMFAAGVPLVEALESVAGACGNIVYEDAV